MERFLEEVRQKGDRLGLVSVQNLFDALGNPQERLPVIQVVGTNGKGSTCGYLSAVLREAGYRVGVFTSPAVFSYEERFTVDGGLLSEAERNSLLGEIEAAYRRLEVEGKALPTLFEVETALAVLYFLQNDCDIAIFEAGMGGDLDATNVFSRPLFTVFTAIGLDHTQFLGETVEEIAAHKAGILRPGGHAVSAWQDAPVKQVLEQYAASVNGTLMMADQQELLAHSYDPLVFSYGKWDTIELGMRGDYQLQNAAAVLLAVELLEKRDYVIGEDAVRRGLRAAFVPGRMERLAVAHPVYLDGAHNIPAARALTDTVRRMLAGQSVTLVIGMLADKAYEEVLSILLPVVSAVVCVTPPSERALDAEELARTARRIGAKEITVASSPQEAVRQAYRAAGDAVLVTGTLTILADMKRAFMDV